MQGNLAELIQQTLKALPVPGAKKSDSLCVTEGCNNPRHVTLNNVKRKRCRSCMDSLCARPGCNNPRHMSKNQLLSKRCLPCIREEAANRPKRKRG